MEKYTVWEGLFKGAPNASKATALLGQMQQLEQQRHAMFQRLSAPGWRRRPVAPPPTE